MQKVLCIFRAYRSCRPTLPCIHRYFTVILILCTTTFYFLHFTNKKLNLRGSSVDSRSWSFSSSVLPPELKPYESTSSNRNTTTSTTSSTSTTTSATSSTSTTTSACHPKTHIMFLKTHKCASSSVQNLFLRYGDTHNLTFILQRQDILLGWPRKFASSSFLPLPGVSRYDLLVHHSVYERSEMARVLLADTTFITIMRQPVSVHESMYWYYGLDLYFNQTFSDFMDDPGTTIRADIARTKAGVHMTPPPVKGKWQSKRLGQVPLRNPILFDLGLVPMDPLSPVHDDDDVIETAIQMLETDFHLTMIAEEFDASLVLLKNLLCWSWDDVVVFRLNSRSDRFRETPEKVKKTQEAVRTWSRLDHAVYSHILGKFKAQIKAFGEEKMKSAIERIVSDREAWMSRCVEQEVESSRLKDPRYRWWSPQVDGFRLKTNLTDKLLKTCEQMTITENAYTNRLKHKQWPKIFITAV